MYFYHDNAKHFLIVQVQVRGKDSQQATEDLHKQLIDAEAFRLQVRVVIVCIV